VGLVWLRRWCGEVGGTEAAGDLGQAVLTLLLTGVATGQGPDEVAGGLLDLLGEAAFERVGELMERR
jgi:hypothetical protein